MASGPKILVIDIETSPNLSHVWDIWRNPVGYKTMLEQWDMMCFSAKWLGEGGPTYSYSEFHDGYRPMLSECWKLLDHADMILSYNGKRFDIKRIRTVLAVDGFSPFSEPRHIDLDVTMKNVFDFPSHSMEYVCKMFGLPLKHVTSYELWRACLLDRDPESWDKMVAYCANDVDMLANLYFRVLPWIERHPSVTPYQELEPGVLSCTKCGSIDLVKDGYSYTNVSVFQRYRCRSCGNRALRGTRRVNVGGTGITEAGI